MSFPIIRGSLANTNGTTAATSQVLNLPATVEPDDLLIVALRGDNATDHTWPAGWNRLFFSTADASDDGFSIAWKKANGTEDGTTITVTAAGVAGKFAAQSMAIFDCADPSTTPPEVTSVALGTSVNPDPGPLTPAGGRLDYKWLALATCEGEQNVNFTEPSGYSDFGNAASSGTASTVDTNCLVCFAGRDNTATTEDVGTWTISVSDDWMAVTMAIYPKPIVVRNVGNLGTAAFQAVNRAASYFRRRSFVWWPGARRPGLSS